MCFFSIPLGKRSYPTIGDVPLPNLVQSKILRVSVLCASSDLFGVRVWPLPRCAIFRHSFFTQIDPNSQNKCDKNHRRRCSSIPISVFIIASLHHLTFTRLGKIPISFKQLKSTPVLDPSIGGA